MEKSNIVSKLNRLDNELNPISSMWRELGKHSRVDEIKNRIKLLKENLEDYDDVESMFLLDESELDDLMLQADNIRTNTKVKTIVLKSEVKNHNSSANNNSIVIEQHSDNDFVFDDFWNKYSQWDEEYIYLSWNTKDINKKETSTIYEETIINNNYTQPQMPDISDTSNYNINKLYYNQENNSEINNNLEESKEYIKSSKIIWKDTLKEIINLYKIKSVSGIKKLQKELWFNNQDWIIWWETLEKIFNKIENTNLDNYPKLKERVELNKEMIELLEKKKLQYPKLTHLKLSPYNHKNYYWYSNHKERIEWNNFLNKKAYSLLNNNNKLNNNNREAPAKINWNNIEDFIITEKIGWLFVTSFYEKGVLKLASLSSPWWEKTKTEKKNIKTTWHEKLHISKKYHLSEMFFAINIWNWEYYHARKSDWWVWIHSKWCVWLPIHYEKELFRLTSWNNTKTYSFVLDN